MVSTVTKELFLLFILHLLCCQQQNVNCLGTFRKWIRWSTLDVTYGSAIVLEGVISMSQCLTKCERSSGCISAHVNHASLKCELSTYYPPHGTLSAIARTGWKVYFRELREVQGIRAWQSSTYLDCVANKSIDGQFNVEDFDTFPGCKCSHTFNYNSSWVMEFQTLGTVVMITPFFRLQLANVFRNTNFRLSVYMSFDDAMNDVNGTICSEYTGAAITSLTDFMCQQPLLGKALRIQHFLAEFQAFLQFCEIKVYIV